MRESSKMEENVSDFKIFLKLMFESRPYTKSTDDDRMCGIDF